jgi:hypothetical protein
MKIEIDIPQLTELNRKLEQLIDTLNDVAVMQINQEGRKRERIEQANAACLERLSPEEIEHAAEPAAKRTRKKREAAPEPEIITYGEAEVQAANEVAQAAAALVTEQEQPAPVAAEEPAPVPAQEETPALPTLFDMDYFRANVIPAIASANKLPEAKEWITQHGAPALKDLDPKHYAAFHKFACELCGVENL